MKKFLDYCAEIMQFFRENGIALDPEPSIRLDRRPVSRFDPYAPTGHYDFTKNEITLHVSNRQCKDILRTFCHELIHVSQYQRDPTGYASFDKSGSLRGNPTLRKYEEEAYMKGSSYFRDWTETKDE